MKILFLTSSDENTASSRQFFYQMNTLLNLKGYNSFLNDFNQSSYDIIIIKAPDLKLLQKAINHTPNAHIGIFNPGPLGYDSTVDYEHENPFYSSVLKNIDFFLVNSFLWRDLILKYKKRVYKVVDYEFPEKKPLKIHNNNKKLIIGYHGNTIHYAEDFFPNGANALRRLSNKYDFTLKVLTNNIKAQPTIEGVDTEFIEWELESYKKVLKSFDIGICPYFSDMVQLSDPFVYIRNPNRIVSLLFYGIPSVASPLQQNLHYLRHEQHVHYAISEDGWYESLETLISSPEQRNRIGLNGRKLVEKRYSDKVAVDHYEKFLNFEINQPIVQKPGVEVDLIYNEKGLSTFSKLFHFFKTFFD